MSKRLSLRLNGGHHQVKGAADTPLLWVIRDQIGLKGTKYGCGMGLCGACTVLMDGQAVRACQVPMSTVGSKAIHTIEAVAQPDERFGHELQRAMRCVHRAWCEQDVPQCGYCQPGQIMEAVALLKRYPKPTDAQIDGAMDGHICRCGSYPEIKAAIHLAASERDTQEPRA